MTTSCALARSAKAREVPHVEEQDGDLDLVAGEVDALLEHALGQARVDEGAERLAQALALLQPGHEAVERARQEARLVAREDGDAGAEVARRHPVGPAPQVAQRPEQRLHEQERQGEGGGEGHPDGGHDPEAQRVHALALAHHADHEHPRDDVRGGQRDEELPAQRQRRAGQVRAVRHPGRHLLEHRAHEQLEREEPQEGVVGQDDGRARGDGEEGPQERPRQHDGDEGRDRDDVHDGGPAVAEPDERQREPGQGPPRGDRGPRRAIALEPGPRRAGEPQGDERRAGDLDRREHLGDGQDPDEAVPGQLVADVELEQPEAAQDGQVAQPELADDRPAHVARATEPAVGRPERGAQHPVT